MVRVAIIGASGYTARESIEILLRHPQAEITCLTGRTEKCGSVTEIFPQFRGRLELPIEPADPKKIAETAEVALVCLPHRVAMEFVPRLLKAGVKVVDFSADYRLHDWQVYEATYEVEHLDKDNLPHAAFGLPELFREGIWQAKLVANPGCYPTAAALAIVPLLREKLIDPADIVVNAVSGVSGAGRKPSQSFHFPEMNENIFAYAAGGTHRHTPEIEQIVEEAAGVKANVLFQPHVACFDRGIGESIYCTPTREVKAEELIALFQETYKNEPFVRVLNQPPKTKEVAFTNFCDIFPAVGKGKVIVFSAIDNLIKGAAGQAVQNMNIISDIEEAMGLI